MKKQHCYNFFSLYKKISETTYYHRNREVILKRAKDYYINNRDEFIVIARYKYIELSEEEK